VDVAAVVAAVDAAEPLEYPPQAVNADNASMDTAANVSAFFMKKPSVFLNDR